MKAFFTILVLIIILGLVGWWLLPRQSAVVVAPAPISGQTQTPAVQPVEITPSITTYQSPQGFSVAYPNNFSVNDGYTYQALGPNKTITGVSFTIPSSTATGTNLSTDSYVSVEWIPNATTCSASNFLADSVKPSSVSDNGITYSVATSSDVGAGNVYDETVYALPLDHGTCYGIRYFIHSTQLANYPAGTVTAFDRQSLVDQFDMIRESLAFTAQTQ